MDPIAALPQLAALIEKGGIIGVLLLVCGVLVWEIRRGRERERVKAEELAKVYGQRDKARLALVQCRAACEAAGVKVHLSDLTDIIGEGT